MCVAVDVEKNVGRLDVSVDVASTVNIVEGGGDMRQPRRKAFQCDSSGRLAADREGAAGDPHVRPRRIH